MEAVAESSGSPAPVAFTAPRLQNLARLLSLDGGGIKGISSLRILQEIMKAVQEEEESRMDEAKIDEAQKENLQKERLPVDYFDLAAGTSTGGIIGILLFRLRMSTSKAIDVYEELAGEVFSPTVLGFQIHKGGWLGYQIGNPLLKLKSLSRRARFSNKPLIKAIDKVVEENSEGFEGTREQKLKLVHEMAGKLIVCATLADEGESILLRTYKTPGSAEPISKKGQQLENDGRSKIENISISTAARATSAAPTFLPEVVWEKFRFWDGGLLNNNPIDQLWDARYDLVGLTDPDPPISCIISLGNGWSTAPAPWYIQMFHFTNTVSTATSFMTNTRAKHRDFQRRIQRLRARQAAQNHTPLTRYFRFDTPTGDETFKLDDYQKMKRLKMVTDEYLNEPQTKEEIRECAKLLIRDRD